LAATKIWSTWPRLKVSRVGFMLKFGRVGLDQNSTKFNRVDPKNTSLENLIYKNWILDFELDLNIWI